MKKIIFPFFLSLLCSLAYSADMYQSFEFPKLTVSEPTFFGYVKEKTTSFSYDCATNDEILSSKEVLNKNSLPISFDIDLYQVNENTVGQKFKETIFQTNLRTFLGSPTIVSNFKDITYISHVDIKKELDPENNLEPFKNKKITYSHIYDGYTISLSPKVNSNKQIFISVCYLKNNVVNINTLDVDGVPVGIPTIEKFSVVQRYLLSEQTKKLLLSLPNNSILSITTTQSK